MNSKKLPPLSHTKRGTLPLPFEFLARVKKASVSIIVQEYARIPRCRYSFKSPCESRRLAISSLAERFVLTSSSFQPSSIMPFNVGESSACWIISILHPRLSAISRSFSYRLRNLDEYALVYRMCFALANLLARSSDIESGVKPIRPPSLASKAAFASRHIYFVNSSRPLRSK